ncbi:zinc ribbon domain-containing protein [bacterium]|nr:MAG: zinc ribbon domain-containing protein [bacterium]
MPTYDYVCESCSHEFEVVQKISDEPLKFCPDCQASTLRKKLTNGNFKLKGKGWFKDGY